MDKTLQQLSYEYNSAGIDSTYDTSTAKVSDYVYQPCSGLWAIGWPLQLCFVVAELLQQHDKIPQVAKNIINKGHAYGCITTSNRVGMTAKCSDIKYLYYAKSVGS